MQLVEAGGGGFRDEYGQYAPSQTVRARAAALRRVASSPTGRHSPGTSPRSRCASCDNTSAATWQPHP